MQGEKTRGSHGEVASALADSVRRAARVADVDEDGEPKPITQNALAQRADISRSVLSKYLARDVQEPANPDLRSLCAMADALGVSPAFLLMRPGDWVVLATAMSTFAESRGDDKFIDLMQGFTQAGSRGPVESARAAVAVAREVKLLSSKPWSDMELIEAERRIEQGIKTTAAVPPFGELNAKYLPMLLTLCAFAGRTATTIARTIES